MHKILHHFYRRSELDFSYHGIYVAQIERGGRGLRLPRTSNFDGQPRVQREKEREREYLS